MHKEELKSIELILGNATWESELGIYYIDMENSEIHYKDNIWNGAFDSFGVPMCEAENGVLSYFPSNIAQYGLLLHSKYIKTKNLKYVLKIQNCVNRLELMKNENNNEAVWYHWSYLQKYKIEAPWPSAMVQGEIISLYLRLYQIDNNVSLLQTSLKAYNFLVKDILKGGVSYIDDNNNLWLEEYPKVPPIRVLNGFIYALFGIIDLYRITHDYDIYITIQKCFKTLKDNLHRYDTGYWSKYDLFTEELVRYYYQKNVHVLQLEVLYILTNEELFLKYSKKWKRNLCAINFLFVKIMYRINWRVKHLKNLMKWKNLKK